MVDYITDAGVFGLITIIAATGGLGMASAQLVVGYRRALDRGALLAAAVALLVGIAGTGFGFSMASGAIASMDLSVVEQADLWRRATGVAWSTTVLGALGAAVDLLGVMVVGFVRSPERRI